MQLSEKKLKRSIIQKKNWWTNKSVNKQKDFKAWEAWVGGGGGVYLHPSSKNTSLKTKHLTKFTRRASCRHLQPWRAAVVHYTTPASSTLPKEGKKRNMVEHKQIQFKSDRPIWKSCVREGEIFPCVFNMSSDVTAVRQSEVHSSRPITSALSSTGVESTSLQFWDFL